MCNIKNRQNWTWARFYLLTCGFYCFQWFYLLPGSTFANNECVYERGCVSNNTFKTNLFDSGFVVLFYEFSLFFKGFCIQLLFICVYKRKCKCWELRPYFEYALDYFFRKFMKIYMKNFGLFPKGNIF